MVQFFSKTKTVSKTSYSFNKRLVWLVLQGVVEFSLCLLFAKLVSYTFLYWLPLYIANVGKRLFTIKRCYNMCLYVASTFWYESFLQPILIRKQRGTCPHSSTLEEFWVSRVAWRLWEINNDTCINSFNVFVLTVYIPGGILAGLVSDYTGGRATTCCVMLIVAAPMVSVSVILWERMTQITQHAHHWF